MRRVAWCPVSVRPEVPASGSAPHSPWALIDFSAVAARHPLTGAQVGSPALRAAFVQPRQVLVAHHLHEVRPLVRAVDAAARAGAWAVGGLCYEAAPAWDAA